MTTQAKSKERTEKRQALCEEGGRRPGTPGGSVGGVVGDWV